MISYQRVQKESDKLLCTVRSLVMVRNQLPAQVVKEIRARYSVIQLPPLPRVDDSLKTVLVESASRGGRVPGNETFDAFLPGNFLHASCPMTRRLTSHDATAIHPKYLASW